MKNKLILPAFVSALLICCFSVTSIAQQINNIKGKYVIVLNMQDHFTQNVLDANTSTQVIDNVNAVIGMADPEKIIYIQSILSKISVSLKETKVDTLPNLNLDSRLNLVNQNIYKKSKPNAFTSNELVNFLEQKGAKDIVVIGVMAGHCVYQTLIEGKELGYKMHFVTEAIAGKSSEEKVKITKKLMKKGINSINL